MPLASFKNKVFQVSSSKKYLLDELQWGGDLNTEAQDKLHNKPSTYIKGENLGDLSFGINLRSDFGVNVRKEIEDWEKIKSDAKPAIFILNGKPIGRNKWLLKSVNITDIQMDGRGMILKANVKLSFEEYVRAGKASTTSTSSSSSSTSSGIRSKSSVNLTPSNYIYKPPDKGDKKRTNPNLAQTRFSGPTYVK